MSIREISKKIKGVGWLGISVSDWFIERQKDLLIIAVIVFLPVLIYGLWFLASLEAAKTPMEVKDLGQDDFGSTQPYLEQGKYVASRSGTKYHLPWCSGAKRIKEGNKVWFNSENEARAAGFAPASNCPGI